MTEYQHHEIIEDIDGYLCKRTGKQAPVIYWEGATPCPPGADLCAHCADWTPGSRLAALNRKREQEAIDERSRKA